MATKLSDVVRATPQYRKYRRVFEATLADFDPVSLDREAKSLHKGRVSRFLEPKNSSPHKLMEANIKDIAARSRLVELRASITSHRILLADLITATRSFLILEFGDSCAYKTKEDRRNYFNRFFQRGEDLSSELERLEEMIDFFVKDIDQCGFAMRNLVELLRMVYTPERAV